MKYSSCDILHVLQSNRMYGTVIKIGFVVPKVTLQQLALIIISYQTFNFNLYHLLFCKRYVLCKVIAVDVLLLLCVVNLNCSCTCKNILCE